MDGLFIFAKQEFEVCFVSVHDVYFYTMFLPTSKIIFLSPSFSWMLVLHFEVMLLPFSFCLRVTSACI